MSEQRNPDTPGGSASREFAEQMAIARKVMDDDWVVLRALALGDQYPDADANTLLGMAKEQAKDRIKPE